jgi:hypothetical protein
MRAYENGDGVGFLWRWWHPATWLLAPLLIIASVLAEGVPTTWRDRHQLGLRMNPWFVEHPERLKWTRNP